MALIGNTLGPLIVDLLSEKLEPTYGVEAIRYAMFALVFLEIAAIYCFYRASKTLKEDLLI